MSATSPIYKQTIDAAYKEQNALPRRRGRPPGSKTRPLAVISKMQREALEKKIGPYLPKDDMAYLANVLDGSEKPNLERDIDVFLALQLKALLPILADEIKTAQLSGEATRRSATVKELLALRVQREKNIKSEETPNALTFIQNVFETRGIDAERILKLVGPPADGSTGDSVASGAQASPVAGDVHDDEGPADSAGAVSGELPE